MRLSEKRVAAFRFVAQVGTPLQSVADGSRKSLMLHSKGIEWAFKVQALCRVLLVAAGFRLRRHNPLLTVKSLILLLARQVLCCTAKPADALCMREPPAQILLLRVEHHSLPDRLTARAAFFLSRRRGACSSSFVLVFLSSECCGWL